MSDTMVVMLAVNDNNGNFTGELEEVDISDVIRIDCNEEPPRIEYHLPLSRIFVGSEVYEIISFRGWVGNMVWDAVRMKTGDAVRLLEQLRKEGWYCEEAESTLFDAWDGDKPLEPVIRRVGVEVGKW